jgi:porin
MRISPMSCAVWAILMFLFVGALNAHARELAAKRPVSTTTVPEETADAEPTIQEIESSNLDSDLSPGEATTVAPAELDEIYAPQSGYLESMGFRSPIQYLIDPLEDLYEKTGLRLGVAHTMLFLQPLGGQSSRYGAAGDLDLMSSWTLIGRGTEDTGRLVLTGEHRYQIGDQPASLVGGQTGTLVAPTGTFNDRGWVIRDAYWIQRLFDARVRILIGRADISDYMGSHWLQNVNNSFINRNFSANAAIPFPGHGPILGISIRPTDQFYVTAGAINAYSDTTESEVESLFSEWDLFSMAEVGYTPTVPGLGEGRYAFAIWHMDARNRDSLPSSSGMSIIADQNLTENLQVFARYSYSDGQLANIRNTAQLGFGYSGLFGRTNDLTGAAFALTFPKRTSTRNEAVIEVFHRLQIAANNQFSVGFQVIATPGNAVEADAAGMFYVRLRTSF